MWFNRWLPSRWILKRILCVLLISGILNPAEHWAIGWELNRSKQKEILLTYDFRTRYLKSWNIKQAYMRSAQKKDSKMSKKKVHRSRIKENWKTSKLKVQRQRAIQWNSMLQLFAANPMNLKWIFNNCWTTVWLRHRLKRYQTEKRVKVSAESKNSEKYLFPLFRVSSSFIMVSVYKLLHISSMADWIVSNTLLSFC